MKIRIIEGALEQKPMVATKIKEGSLFNDSEGMLYLRLYGGAISVDDRPCIYSDEELGGDESFPSFLACTYADGEVEMIARLK